MKIVTKPLPELTSAEYKACASLTMRDHGLMMYSLQDNRKNPRAYAVLAMDEKLLGWAILIPLADEVSWYASSYQRKHSKFVTQFYVRKNLRNKGIGTALMDGVNKLEPRPVVIPHDPCSGGFFAKHKVITNRDRRDIINDAKKRKGGRHENQKQENLQS